MSPTLWSWSNGAASFPDLEHEIPLAPPQGRALQWLADQDEFPLEYPLEDDAQRLEFRQRFALASLVSQISPLMVSVKTSPGVLLLLWDKISSPLGTIAVVLRVVFMLGFRKPTT